MSLAGLSWISFWERRKRKYDLIELIFLEIDLGV